MNANIVFNCKIANVSISLNRWSVHKVLYVLILNVNYVYWMLNVILVYFLALKIKSKDPVVKIYIYK